MHRLATSDAVPAATVRPCDMTRSIEIADLTWQLRSGKADLPIAGKPGIMPALIGLIPELATLAQSAEQTLRKRQVKGSSPLGGLIDIGRPQPLPVGAFALSSASHLQHGQTGPARPMNRYRKQGHPCAHLHLRLSRQRHG